MLPNKQTGSPDFGLNQATNPTSPSYDSGEDTTRVLMGGGALARSGRWIFADGFEGGTINPYESIVLNGAAAIETTDSYQGNNCVKLTANAAVGNYSTLRKSFLLPGSKYGFEFMFAKLLSSPLVNCEIQIAITGYGKGSSRNLNNFGKIVLARESGSNYLYWDVNGSRTLISDITRNMGLSVSVQDWHYVKFVYDLSSNTGVRLFFDDLYFDLSSYSGYQSISTGYAPFNVFDITAKNTEGTIIHNWMIDNLIITADEP